MCDFVIYVNRQYSHTASVAPRVQVPSVISLAMAFVAAIIDEVKEGGKYVEQRLALDSTLDPIEVEERLVYHAQLGQKLEQHLVKYYLTQEEWGKLMSTSISVLTKMDLLVTRILRLGITRPHEQTYKWAVGVLLICHWTKSFPKYSEVFIILEDMKKLISTSASPCQQRHSALSQ